MSFKMNREIDGDDLLDNLDPNQNYTNRQLEAMTDALLRENARSELCRECGAPGAETGEIIQQQQDIQDANGVPLVLLFPVVQCKNNHTWFKGEGKERGIGGENPILFEEHIQSRRRREIYTSVGTPDPEIVQGLYNRCHPQGRKVNSEAQRKKNGASFYR